MHYKTPQCISKSKSPPHYKLIKTHWNKLPCWNNLHNKNKNRIKGPELEEVIIHTPQGCRILMVHLNFTKMIIIMWGARQTERTIIVNTVRIGINTTVIHVKTLNINLSLITTTTTTIIIARTKSTEAHHSSTLTHQIGTNDHHLIGWINNSFKTWA